MKVSPSPAIIRWVGRTCTTLAALCVIAGAAFGQSLPPNPPGSLMQPGNAGGFEIDGSLRCTEVAFGVTPGEDWHFNPPNFCVGVIDNTTCAENPARAPALFFRDPNWATATDP